MNYIFQQRERERNNNKTAKQRNKKQATTMLMSSKNSTNQNAAKERAAVGRKWTDKMNERQPHFLVDFLWFLFFPWSRRKRQQQAPENIQKQVIKHYVKYSRCLGIFTLQRTTKNGRWEKREKKTSLSSSIIQCVNFYIQQWVYPSTRKKKLHSTIKTVIIIH